MSGACSGADNVDIEIVSSLFKEPFSQRIPDKISLVKKVGLSLFCEI